MDINGYWVGFSSPSFKGGYVFFWASSYSSSSSAVKNPPAIQEPQETWVQSLGQEDSMEEGMANHSSILTWRIPWTEEPGRLQLTGLQRVRHK